MKKYIFLLIIIGTQFSCDQESIYKEYQNFNRSWNVVNISPNITATNELEYIDFSLCKMSKKLSKKESASCIASINDSKAGGLSMNYTLFDNNEVLVREVRVLQVNLEDGFQTLPITEVEKRFSEYFKGEWQYKIEGNKMAWARDGKEITFESN